MQTVRLVGNIAQFGATWKTNCSTVRDIFKLIECQTEGFRKYLIEADKAGIGYEIRKGKDILQDEEDLMLSTIDGEEIIITEVPDGAKKGLKILAGIILLVVSYFFPPLAPVLVPIGASLISQGITELLAPGPETEKDQKDAYLFNGPVNNISQGLPVPILYGELLVGGGAISAFYNSVPVNIQGGAVTGNSNSETLAGNSAINYNGGENVSISSYESSFQNFSYPVAATPFIVDWDIFQIDVSGY